MVPPRTLLLCLFSLLALPIHPIRGSRAVGLTTAPREPWHRYGGALDIQSAGDRPSSISRRLHDWLCEAHRLPELKDLECYGIRLAISFAYLDETENLAKSFSYTTILGATTVHEGMDGSPEVIYLSSQEYEEVRGALEVIGGTTIPCACFGLSDRAQTAFVDRLNDAITSQWHSNVNRFRPFKVPTLSQQHRGDTVAETPESDEQTLATTEGSLIQRLDNLLGRWDKNRALMCEAVANSLQNILTNYFLSASGRAKMPPIVPACFKVFRAFTHPLGLVDSTGEPVVWSEIITVLRASFHAGFFGFLRRIFRRPWGVISRITAQELQDLLDEVRTLVSTGTPDYRARNSLIETLASLLKNFHVSPSPKSLCINTHPAGPDCPRAEGTYLSTNSYQSWITYPLSLKSVIVSWINFVLGEDGRGAMSSLFRILLKLLSQCDDTQASRGGDHPGSSRPQLRGPAVAGTGGRGSSIAKELAMIGEQLFATSHEMPEAAETLKSFLLTMKSVYPAFETWLPLASSNATADPLQSNSSCGDRRVRGWRPEVLHILLALASPSTEAPESFRTDFDAWQGENLAELTSSETLRQAVKSLAPSTKTTQRSTRPYPIAGKVMIERWSRPQTLKAEPKCLDPAAAVDLYLEVVQFKESSPLTVGEFILAKILDQTVFDVSQASVEPHCNPPHLAACKHHRAVALWLKYIQCGGYFQTGFVHLAHRIEDPLVAAVVFKHLDNLKVLDDASWLTEYWAKAPQVPSLILSSLLLTRRCNSAGSSTVYLSETVRASLFVPAEAEREEEPEGETTILEILRALAYLIFDVSFERSRVRIRRHYPDLFLLNPDLVDCNHIFNSWLPISSQMVRVAFDRRQDQPSATEVSSP